MPDQPSPAQQIIGDFAPKLVELTDDVLFGDVWERPGLAKRDRSPRSPSPPSSPSTAPSSSPATCAAPSTTASPRTSSSR